MAIYERTHTTIDLVVLKEEVEWSWRAMWGRSFPAILKFCECRVPSINNKKPWECVSPRAFCCACVLSVRLAWPGAAIDESCEKNI